MFDLQASSISLECSACNADLAFGRERFVSTPGEPDLAGQDCIQSATDDGEIRSKVQFQIEVAAFRVGRYLRARFTAGYDDIVTE